MRWPWQRRGTSPQPIDRPRSDRPSPAGWAFLPPLQRTVGLSPAISNAEQFPAGLAAWTDPSFLGQASHLVDPAAPAGVIDVDGGGLPSEPAAPTIPLEMPLHASGAAERRAAQGTVGATAQRVVAGAGRGDASGAAPNSDFADARMSSGARTPEVPGGSADPLELEAGASDAPIGGEPSGTEPDSAPVIEDPQRGGVDGLVGTGAAGLPGAHPGPGVGENRGPVASPAMALSSVWSELGQPEPDREEALPLPLPAFFDGSATIVDLPRPPVQRSASESDAERPATPGHRLGFGRPVSSRPLVVARDEIPLQRTAPSPYVTGGSQQRRDAATGLPSGDATSRSLPVRAVPFQRSAADSARSPGGSTAPPSGSDPAESPGSSGGPAGGSDSSGEPPGDPHSPWKSADGSDDSAALADEPADPAGSETAGTAGGPDPSAGAARSTAPSFLEGVGLDPTSEAPETPVVARWVTAVGDPQAGDAALRFPGARGIDDRGIHGDETERSESRASPSAAAETALSSGGPRPPGDGGAGKSGRWTATAQRSDLSAPVSRPPAARGPASRTAVQETVDQGPAPGSGEAVSTSGGEPSTGAPGSARTPALAEVEEASSAFHSEVRGPTRDIPSSEWPVAARLPVSRAEESAAPEAMSAGGGMDAEFPGVSGARAAAGPLQEAAPNPPARGMAEHVIGRRNLQLVSAPEARPSSAGRVRSPAVTTQRSSSVPTNGDDESAMPPVLSVASSSDVGRPSEWPTPARVASLQRTGTVGAVSRLSGPAAVPDPAPVGAPRFEAAALPQLVHAPTRTAHPAARPSEFSSGPRPPMGATVQRAREAPDAAPEEPSQGDAPQDIGAPFEERAEQPGAGASTRPTEVAGITAVTSEQIEALADRLLGPLTRRLKAEMLLDRERRGVRMDAR